MIPGRFATRPQSRRNTVATAVALLAVCLFARQCLVAATPAEQVRRGQSPAEVRQLLGLPNRIARQILFRRHIEQWVYDDPPARVEFDCVRGQEPWVRGVHRGRASP